MVDSPRKTLIKYDSKGVGSSFWQELYGYSKEGYEYPGLLDEIPGAERLAETLIAVPEDKAEVVKGFLREHGAEFEERGSMSPASKGPQKSSPQGEPDRESLEGLGEKIDRLGPFIKSETKRNAREDVEMYGY